MPNKNLDDTLRRADGQQIPPEKLHPNNLNSGTNKLPGTEHDLQGYSQHMTRINDYDDDVDERAKRKPARIVESEIDLHDELQEAEDEQSQDAASATIAKLERTMDFSTRGRTLMAHKLLHMMASEANSTIPKDVLIKWHSRVVRAMQKWDLNHVMADELDETLSPTLKKKSIQLSKK